MTNLRSPSIGAVIANRYRILSLLGQGGFGRSYLAEDRHRFDEPCVLKEFAPQLQGSQALQKAKALFQREAGILYQLHHPQIPAFRELLETEFQGQNGLFLVQQYIPGQTYLAHLHQGLQWQETDAIQFLCQILPVLDYLHRQGIIHRDLAPDNLICEATQRWPVLIDFGAVKQVAISAIQQFSPRGQAVATVVAKLGYTPPEQQYGQPVAASDLYALGVTTLVLLTGRSPAELRDRTTGEWNWRPWLSLTPAFTTVLTTLLADRVSDRYPSAIAVLADLEALAGGQGSVTPPGTGSRSRSGPSLRSWISALGRSVSRAFSQLPTLVVAPRRPAQGSQVVAASPITTMPSAAPGYPRYRWLGRWLGRLGWLLLVPVLALLKAVVALGQWGLRGVLAVLLPMVRTILAKLILGGLVLLLVFGFVEAFSPQLPPWLTQPQLPQLPQLPPIAIRWPRQSVPDASCQEYILTEMQARNIPASERSRLYAIVDEQFYAAYPHLKGRELTDAPADAPFRRAWCRLAAAAIAAD